jgi:hypothetical protein
VAVAEASAGGVLRHVPAVHDGVGAVVRAAADVDLAGRTAAAAAGVAGGCEATAAIELVGVSGPWGWMCLPCVAGGIDGREGDAAVDDLEEGLVLQVQGACESGGEGLWEADDLVMVDDGATEEVEREGGDAGRGGEELDGEVAEVGVHLGVSTQVMIDSSVEKMCNVECKPVLLLTIYGKVCPDFLYCSRYLYNTNPPLSLLISTSVLVVGISCYASSPSASRSPRCMQPHRMLAHAPERSQQLAIFAMHR